MLPVPPGGMCLFENHANEKGAFGLRNCNRGLSPEGNGLSSHCLFTINVHKIDHGIVDLILPNPDSSQPIWLSKPSLWISQAGKHKKVAKGQET